jgi:hypothetical protein
MQAAHPVPSTPHIDLTAPWIDPRKPDDEPVSHLAWAEGIARQIATAPKFGFKYRSQEADDLVSVAHATLIRLAKRFDFAKVSPGGDPDQMLRGWSRRYLTKECAREAERLQNGGTYHTTSKREAQSMRVGGLPEFCPCPPDETDEHDEPDAEPITQRFVPVLVLWSGVRIVMAGKTNNRGIVCPKCGAPKLQVTKTLHPVKGLTVRYRKCKACNERVRTEERAARSQAPATAG